MADKEEVNFNVCAVLPAAGSGLRTGLEIPKQVTSKAIAIEFYFKASCIAYLPLPRSFLEL